MLNRSAVNAPNPAIHQSTQPTVSLSPRSPFPVPRSPFPVPRSPFPVPFLMTHGSIIVLPMSVAVQPRWRRLPEERPSQIVDAALDVFAERGLAAARIDDIAKRAGLSKGTIYLYFPNKEALFREVIRRTVVSQIERGERDFEHATTTATERLE